MKTNRIIRLWLVILMCALRHTSIAEELHYPPYAVPLMIRPQDPVVAAMGLTGTAYRSGPLSALTNPAGLSWRFVTELAGVHVPAQGQGLIPENRPQYLNQESVALGYPFSRFVLGGMFLYYNLGISSEGQENGSTVNHFVRFYQISCSRRFALSGHTDLSAGLNLKRIENKLIYKQGVGYSGDFGFQIRHHREKRILRAGVSVSNIGLDFRYKQHLDTEYETPLQLLRVGAAFTVLDPFGFFHTELTAAVGYHRNLNHDPSCFQNWEILGSGVECGVFDVLYIRAGMVFDLEKRVNAESIEGFTLGFGFRTEIPFESMPPLHLKLDYGRGLQIQNLNRNVISLALGYDLQMKERTRD